jgi:predicted N-formylglutamate amidohydrolase
VLAILQASGDLIVGDNQPYSIETEIDYSIPFHALRRGLRHLQLELRQDEIADADGQQRWAVRLAEVFTQALDDVTTYCV